MVSITGKVSGSVSTIQGYDVFLLAGQSNTYSGREDTGDNNPDATLDSTDTDILQVGRWDSQDGDIILAEEPLDCTNGGVSRPDSSWVGFALAFAKKYKHEGYLRGNRKIIIVPAGVGGSSFSSNNWNDGDSEYEDAITRTNIALGYGSGYNELKAVLWQQGEDDTGNTTNANAYEAKLLAMIDAMRTDFGNSSLPFTIGGMVPAYVTARGTAGTTVQTALSNVPNNRTYTGYANPSTPTVLTASSLEATDVHYSADSMRGSSQDFDDVSTLGLAGRHWTAYLQALSNT